MKAIIALVAAGGLLAVAQQASACPGSQDKCPTGGGFMLQMDQNGDGSISQKEFNAFHAKRFKEMDTNKDGKISSDEMVAMHGSYGYGMGGHGMMGGKKHMSFEQHFDAADTNHDGALSKEEAKENMPILYDRFDENDANKDGKITKDEVMRERPMRGPGMMRGNP